MCLNQKENQTKEEEERNNSLFIGFIFASVAAVCFVLAILAGFAELSVAAEELDFMGKSAVAMQERRDRYQNLNTTSLKKLWKFRIETQFATAFLDVILALGWFSALPVFLTLSKLWKGMAELQVLLPCVATTVFLAVMNLCINAGVAEGTAEIASWPIMKQSNGGFGAYQALEIAYLTSRSASTWVSSVDLLLLSVAALCAGLMSLRTMVMFPCWYSVLTFCVSGAAMGGFILSWGSKNRTVLGFFGMMYLATTLLFVVWLVLTAMRFWKMLRQDQEARSDDEMKTEDPNSMAVDMPDDDHDKPPMSPSEVAL